MLKKLLLLVMLPVASHAQSTDYGSVQLLRGWQLPDGSYQMALAFELNPGWKTYWRSPGPAGLPPVFDWAASDNIGAIDMRWPTPEVMDQGGMITLGYYKNLVLPITITPESEGPVRIALNLQFGVCSDICVPAQAAFLARLDGSADEGSGIIRAALATVPQSGASAGLASINCTVEPSGDGFMITADMAFENALAIPFTVFEYGSEEIWIDMAESQSDGLVVSASAPLTYYGRGDMNMDAGAVTVSVFGSDRAVEIRGCPGPG